MKSRLQLLIIISIVTISLVGCYTVLRHPKATGDLGYTSDYYDPDGCNKCHMNDAYTLSVNADYYGYYSPWLDYYQRPWWWDAYWGDDWYYENNGGWRPDGVASPQADRAGYPIGGAAITPAAIPQSEPTKVDIQNRNNPQPTKERSKVPVNNDQQEGNSKDIINSDSGNAPVQPGTPPTTNSNPDNQTGQSPQPADE